MNIFVTLKKNMYKLLDIVIKFRYLIALIVFIFILLFKLNGSSIGMWDKVLTENGEKQAANGILFGNPRQVRSDEWLVQTPFSISQSQTGSKLVNDTLSPSGQNMIVAYNSPTWNIVSIGKIFNWGYLFFGAEYGLSWSWGIKLIGLILLSFEFTLILTKRNKYLSLLGSLLITLSPGVQWWFVSPVADLVFFTLGILVSVYNYFYFHENKNVKIAMAGFFIINSIGFVLVLYPPLQVPFVYLILGIFVAYIFEFKSKIKLNKFDFICIPVSIIVIFSVLAYAVLLSKDALTALMNTSYPGIRFNPGGGGNLPFLSIFLTNWLIPYRDISFLNNSEVSSFYNFFPLVLLMSPFIFYKKIKENIIGFVLFLYCCLNLAWIFVPMPKIIGKLTLMSYVTVERAYLTFSFSAMLLSLWFINYIWNSKKLNNKTILFLSGTSATFYLYSIQHSEMMGYFSNKSFVITIFVFTLWGTTVFLKKKRYFYILSIVIIFFSGLYVNPLNRGVGAIFNKKLSQAIIEINDKDKGKTWVTDADTPAYNLVPALGVKSLNSVIFYPSVKTWEPLDPEGTSKEIYNRYAHILVNIVEDDSNFQLMGADRYKINLNTQDLSKYDISYVLSTNSSLEQYSTDTLLYDKIYGPDQDNYSIYSVNYKNN